MTPAELAIEGFGWGGLLCLVAAAYIEYGFTGGLAGLGLLFLLTSFLIYLNE